MSSDLAPARYRLARSVARHISMLTVGVAVVFGLIVTVMVAAAHGSGALELTIMGVGVVVVIAFVVWLHTAAFVVSCDAEGYVVRLVRGAGVKRAAWHEVSGASATYVHDIPVFLLELKDGRTTSIPVSLLATDRDEFARQMQRRLGDDQGTRPL